MGEGGRVAQGERAAAAEEKRNFVTKMHFLHHQSIQATLRGGNCLFCLPFGKGKFIPFVCRAELLCNLASCIEVIWPQPFRKVMIISEKKIAMATAESFRINVKSGLHGF